jgi:hypothetical protein
MKTRHPRFVAVVLVSLLGISTPSFATKDTEVRVGPDGLLERVPPNYFPASLRITFANSLELKIGSKAVVVPQCVMRMVNTREMKDVIVMSNWNRQGLPGFSGSGYISITLNNPGHDRMGHRTGYTLHFDITAMKLLGMEVNIASDEGTSMQMVPVDLAALCSSAELKTFFDKR